MNALILVDIQNDFCSGGALEVPQGSEIIPLANRLQENFPLVVATQDWHPLNHKSFASNHPGEKPFNHVLLDGLDQMLWPDHCVQNSEGAKFHPDLKTSRVEAIFRKGMNPSIDSYSGFFDNGHLKSTGLAGYLKERKVTDVFVCGLAGDYCVYFTALDAITEGFNTYYIEDATRSITSEGFLKAKAAIQKSTSGQVIRSADVLT